MSRSNVEKRAKLSRQFLPPKIAVFTRNLLRLTFEISYCQAFSKILHTLATLVWMEGLGKMKKKIHSSHRISKSHSALVHSALPTTLPRINLINNGNNNRSFNLLYCYIDSRTLRETVFDSNLSLYNHYHHFS
jgi:hypothetical protein